MPLTHFSNVCTAEKHTLVHCISALPLGEDVAGTESHDAEGGGKDRYKAGKKEYSCGNCNRRRREVICEVYGLTAAYVKNRF